jgi:NitT/TauT family transport system ATP-binding protein
MHGAEMRDPGPMLSVRIDRKAFASRRGDARQVLRDIAFSVHGGEVVALLGASGSGKTTTLRILLGLDPVYEGEMRINARRVGVMLQEPLLLPWLDVAANLRLVVPRGDPAPDIGALLNRVQLPGAAPLFPRQLSLGMARRAALARALAVSPDVLVLDEPFASLDARTGAALGQVVADHAKSDGAAVLMAMHDVGQALAIAARLLILAGQPATLAADLTVPADAGRRAALLTSLTTAFPFLTGDRPDEAYPDQPKQAFLGNV